MIIETSRRKRQGNTLALFHFDSASLLSDECGGNWAQYNGDIVAETTKYKFGGSSAKFKGGASRGSYLMLDDIKFALEKHAFTIDFWYITPHVGDRATVFSLGTYLNDGITLICSYNNQLVLFIDNPSSAQIAEYGSISTISHIAIVGNGLEDGSRGIKLYCNGVLLGYCIYDYNILSTSFKVGGFLWGSSTSYYQIIDEFRVSNIARWTSDFTPPSAPYTLD